jgi:GNAT superfamily N-acetyltransferase
VFVAEEDGHILGFLWVHLIEYANTRIAYIEELFVHEDHRRRGLGSALVARTVEWLAEANVPVMFVSTTAGDRIAQQFYRAEGFVRTRGPWFYLVPSSRGKP